MCVLCTYQEHQSGHSFQSLVFREKAIFGKKLNETERKMTEKNKKVWMQDILKMQTRNSEFITRKIRE